MTGSTSQLRTTKLSATAEAASEISEEFRPGNPRRLTDEQVKEKMSRIRELYALTEEKIKKYEEG